MFVSIEGEVEEEEGVHLLTLVVVVEEAAKYQ